MADDNLMALADEADQGGAGRLNLLLLLWAAAQAFPPRAITILDMLQFLLV